MHVSKGTSSEDWLVTLNRLLQALSIFEIRNAVSHPNRPFPNFYWYRCAAIASDPSIDALGLAEVARAFSDAQEGRIQEPPEDWMHRMRWSVPAILPNEFEHSITGLVGRAKDTARLERELENSRLPLIAIVARGGVGKTSLLLQVVSDFCLASRSANHFDAVVWETLKQERLTIDGVEQLSAPASLEEIKLGLTRSLNELFGCQETSWEGIVNATKDRRVLLCLDNLEVLLRDNAADFQLFNESLPPSWKVIVTSRIPVDGAKNLPLEVLEKSGGVAMVRAYLSARGHPESKDSSFMEKIAIGCKFNPLAIRLTVDLFIAGQEIDFALHKTEQDVLSFSFTSLLESLGAIDNDILEALFALSWSTRFNLCNALKVEVDDVAESLSTLLSMSLILRREQQGAEEYSLSPSIRDLLRAHPRRLAVRGRVASWLSNSRASAEQAQRIQAEKGISPIAPNYIPPNTPAAYITLCLQSNSAAKHANRAVLNQNLVVCRSKIGLDSDSSFLHRVHGSILLGLDDPVEAILSFERAHSLSPEDPAPLFCMLIAFNDLHRWPEIEQVGEKLIAMGWGEPEKSGSFYANRIWSATLRSANVAEDVTKVFEQTENWQDRLGDLPALGVSRGAAYRRVIEIEDRQGRLEVIRLGSLLAKAANVLSKVVVENDFAKWICGEVGRLIGDIKRNESRNLTLCSAEDHDRISEFLRFCAKNGTRLMLEGVPATLLDHCRKTLGDSFSAAVQTDPDTSEKYKTSGYLITKVKSTLLAGKRFFFVQDEFRQDYYVNLDIFENGKTKNRRKLVSGTRIAIKVSDSKKGSAPQAIEAWLVA